MVSALEFLKSGLSVYILCFLAWLERKDLFKKKSYKISSNFTIVNVQILMNKSLSTTPITTMLFHSVEQLKSKHC